MMKMIVAHVWLICVFVQKVIHFFYFMLEVFLYPLLDILDVPDNGDISDADAFWMVISFLKSLRMHIVPFGHYYDDSLLISPRIDRNAAGPFDWPVLPELRLYSIEPTREEIREMLRTYIYIDGVQYNTRGSWHGTMQDHGMEVIGLNVVIPLEHYEDKAEYTIDCHAVSAALPVSDTLTLVPIC